MDPNLLHEYQCRAVELLEYACNGDEGRLEEDPIYQQITEGRDRGRTQRTYSSCGDLAHWMYFHLGVRLDFVNRAEFNGFIHGVNVSRLVYSSGCARNIPKELLQAGDVLIIANDWPAGSDAHIVCIIDQPSPIKLSTAEYGQPGGNLRTRAIHGNRMCAIHADNTLSSGRRMRVVLKLDEVLDKAAKEDKLVR